MKIFTKVSALLLITFFTLHAADFLKPSEAFKPYAKVSKESQILVGIEIAPEIYLYKNKLNVSLLEVNGISIKKIVAPKSVEHMGDAVYLKSPEFVLTLQKEKAFTGMQDVKIKVEYQGCSEQGLCYEPGEKVFTLQVESEKLSNKGAVAPTETQKSQSKQRQNRSETDLIVDTIKSSGFLVVLATFFIFGLLLSLTPCVFPMIPIISGVIISQGEGLTTKKAFGLSLVYVLAMAVAYTIAGVFAGLFGSNLQAALQTPWVVYSFAAVFVVLAFSMFGFYELKLPDALVSRVSQNSGRGGFIGVAVMGFFSALIVGPCVAAPLAGALVYIGQTGDALLGGSALFVMSLGMGIPLILVGVSAGKFMPKPGAWMTMVNAIFGVLMLGVAVWMLEKVVSLDITTLLYAMLGLGFALYLGVFDNSGHIFKRTVALLIFLYSLALFIGVLAGAPCMTQPLGFLKVKSVAMNSMAERGEALKFTRVASLGELNALLEKNRGKKIVLDFAADWCTACRELEEVTFADSRVEEKLREFVLIRADVTENGEKEKALSKTYGVFGPPALIFFNKDGKVIKAKTVIGFVKPDVFVKHLNSF